MTARNFYVHPLFHIRRRDFARARPSRLLCFATPTPDRQPLARSGWRQTMPDEQSAIAITSGDLKSFDEPIFPRLKSASVQRPGEEK
jgi:hypothetical protein